MLEHERTSARKGLVTGTRVSPRILTGHCLELHESLAFTDPPSQEGPEDQGCQYLFQARILQRVVRSLGSRVRHARAIRDQSCASAGRSQTALSQLEIELGLRSNWIQRMSRRAAPPPSSVREVRDHRTPLGVP